MALALLTCLLCLVAVATLVKGGDAVCEILRLSANGIMYQATHYNPDLGFRRTCGTSRDVLSPPEEEGGVSVGKRSSSSEQFRRVIADSGHESVLI